MLAELCTFFIFSLKLDGTPYFVKNIKMINLIIRIVSFKINMLKTLVD